MPLKPSSFQRATAGGVTLSASTRTISEGFCAGKTGSARPAAWMVIQPITEMAAKKRRARMMFDRPRRRSRKRGSMITC
jgi:hypothetical protein